MFTPKLEILPFAQRKLWNELKDTPEEFVLYGGTALALRLGHRSSEDFDFFSNQSFAPDVLRKAMDRGGPVKVSFFGGLMLNRVQDPDVAPDNGIQVASLLDVAATKLATIQQRAQARDYEDIAAIIAAEISLSEVLAAAIAAYGKQFNGALSLKALTCFADGDLPQLSSVTQRNLKQIPIMKARVGVTGGGAGR
jgi:predicted nucleotidyltransferase component of viral defense system